MPPESWLRSSQAANGKPYLKVDFKEIFVTGLQMSAAGEVPAVSLSFTYNEIKIDYSAQDEKGNVASTGPVTMNAKRTSLRKAAARGRAFTLQGRKAAGSDRCAW